MRHPTESPHGTGHSPTKPATIGLVVHCRHYREALASALRPHFILSDLGDGSAVEILERLLRLQPDIALIDVPLKDAALLIRETYRFAPTVRMIALNQSEDESTAVSLFEVGLTAYMERSASVGDIRGAIREVLAGEVRCPPRITAALVRRLNVVGRRRTPDATAAKISPREVQVLPLLELGLTNKEIARCLGIEQATAKNHVHNILHKFGVHRRGEAVRHYLEDPPRLQISPREGASPRGSKGPRNS